MKKDRNCMGMPYPNYMPNMMGVPPIYNPNMNFPNNSSIEQQLSNLSNQVSSLERRVSNLENLVGNNSTTYNTTNYQML